MADVKISGLPASTTPLAGTEVLPIVQGGATKQVSVANLTAGRAVNAASLSVTDSTSSAAFATVYNTSFYTTDGVISNFAANNGLYINGNATGWAQLNGDGSGKTFVRCFGNTAGSPNLIQFNTNNTERMRIHATGGVSIGNTVDAGATNLSVTGTIACASQISSSSNDSIYLGNASFSQITSTNTLYINTVSNAIVIRPGTSEVGSFSSTGLAVTGVVTSSSTIKTGGYTVATLPAGTVGMRAYVTDAVLPTYLGALTGGGAVTCPVFYNGAAWVSA